MVFPPERRPIAPDRRDHPGYWRNLQASGTGKPNQTLLAALLQTPRGQVTIQLHGDTPLIDTLVPDFDRMLLRITPVSLR